MNRWCVLKPTSDYFPLLVGCSFRGEADVSAVIVYLLAVIFGATAAAFIACGADTFMIATMTAHLGMFCGML